MRAALADGVSSGFVAAAVAGIVAAAGIAARNPLSFFDGLLLAFYIALAYSVVCVPAAVAFASALALVRPQSREMHGSFLVALFVSLGAAVYGLSWLQVKVLPDHIALVKLGWGLTILFFVFVIAVGAAAFCAARLLRSLRSRLLPERAPWAAWTRPVLIAAAAIVVFAALASPRGPSRVETQAPIVGRASRVSASAEVPHGRLLVIAADGLSWNVAGPMIRDGRLPHLARLLQNGRGVSLHTRTSVLTPVVWTAFATGRLPEENGIEDFTATVVRGLSRPYATLRVTPFVGIHGFETAGESLGLVKRVPFNSAHRRVPAIWEIASKQGLSCGVIGYPVTWPADPLPGVSMITEQALVSVLSRRTWPESLTVEAQEEIGRARREGAGIFEPERAVRTSVEKDAAFTALARRMLRRGDRDLVIVYLNAADSAGHLYWGFHRPDQLLEPPSDDERARRGDLLEKAYDQLDDRIGELIDAAGEGASVVLLSDHGMKAQPHLRWLGYHRLPDGGHVNGPPGVWIASGPAFARTGTFEGDADALDVLPTLLAALGLPVAFDLPGSVQRGLLAPDLGSPRMIASFGARPRPIPAPESDAADRELLARLKSLGYMN